MSSRAKKRIEQAEARRAVRIRKQGFVVGDGEDDLRALAKAASPGPWEADPSGLYVLAPKSNVAMIADQPQDYGEPPEDAIIRLRGAGAVNSGYVEPEQLAANLRYMAAVNPTVVLGLLDRIEELHRQLAETREGVRAAAVALFSIHESDLENRS